MGIAWCGTMLRQHNLFYWKLKNSADSLACRDQKPTNRDLLPIVTYLAFQPMQDQNQRLSSFLGPSLCDFFPGGGGGWVFTQPANQPANNRTCFGHHPHMLWASSRHVLGIIHTCFGHLPDMFWASSGHVLGIIRPCFGRHPDLFWASSGHVLGIIWRCFGYHPDMFCKSSGQI